MEKSDYKLLFNDEATQLPEMNKPFYQMRSSVELKGKEFFIWKLTSTHQNIHEHDYYQLWYILRGSCSHTIDTRKFNLSDGDLILIPPFSYHSMDNGTDDLIVIGIDFTESFFSSNDSVGIILMSCINSLCLKQNQHTSVFFAKVDIEHLILEMYNEYALKNEYYDIVIKNNLSKLIVMIKRMALKDANTYDDDSERVISSILRYIHKNLSEKISINELCKLANISSTSLHVLFKNSTGKTIVEYINTLKIDKAKQLLAETDMSITDISYELGFFDSSYFYRVFKKYAKYSPKDFKRLRCTKNSKNSSVINKENNNG